MINPIGTFLTHTDAALTGSMGGIISSMTSSMATPVTVLAIIYYAVQGLRLANGDPDPPLHPWFLMSEISARQPLGEQARSENTSAQ